MRKVESIISKVLRVPLLILASASPHFFVFSKQRNLFNENTSKKLSRKRLMLYSTLLDRSDEYELCVCCIFCALAYCLLYNYSVVMSPLPHVTIASKTVSQKNGEISHVNRKTLLRSCCRISLKSTLRNLDNVGRRHD